MFILVYKLIVAPGLVQVHGTASGFTALVVKGSLAQAVLGVLGFSLQLVLFVAWLP